MCDNWDLTLKTAFIDIGKDLSCILYILYKIKRIDAYKREKKKKNYNNSEKYN